MNNRKQTNQKGKNPRGRSKQVIVEKPTIVRDIKGQEVNIPNPRYPGKRTIYHVKQI